MIVNNAPLPLPNGTYQTSCYNWWDLPHRCWTPKWEGRLFRDSQRQKIYDAEGSVFCTFWARGSSEGRLQPIVAMHEDRLDHRVRTSLLTSSMSISQAQEVVNSICLSDWAKMRFPGIQNKIPVVERARSKRASSYRSLFNTIQLTVTMCNTWTVIHELCHAFSVYFKEDDEKSTILTSLPGHSRRFARCELDLVMNWYGPEVHDMLKDEFVKYGVKFSPYKYCATMVGVNLFERRSKTWR